MKFSQRIGNREVKTELNRAKMSAELRNSLWTLILEYIINHRSDDDGYGGEPSSLLKYFRALCIIPHLADARNYFIFSFYTRGMNYTDMMVLKWQDVDAKTISYIRNKTKGRFVITILPPVREILNYYEQHSLPTKYVFPILLKDGLTPAQIDHRKKKTLAKYNRDLKEIAGICGIKKSLSSYVARHSFANCLKQKGVATDVIGESLGHKDLTTTQVYLKELGSNVLDKAVELLL